MVPSPNLTYVHAIATQITGQYHGNPMSVAFSCDAQFAILDGSVPNNSSATSVHVHFTQGDSIARLLEQSKKLSLVFNSKGELVGPDQ
jgi:hypothetical protein